MTTHTTLTPRPSPVDDRERLRLRVRGRRWEGRAVVARYADQLAFAASATDTPDYSGVPWRATALCGRGIVDDDGTVAVHRRVDEDGRATAYVSGVMRCGSVSLCECCSATIRAHRQAEVSLLAGRHAAAGGRASMGTLTVKHHRGDSLAEVFGWLRDPWAKIQRRGWWRKLRKSALVGTVTALEVTTGDNGWHVHLHILLLWGPEAGNAPAYLDEKMRVAWPDAVEKASGKRPNHHGWHQTDVTSSEAVARYLAKIAGEVTRSDYKTRDALTVITEAMGAGEAEGFARWHEWVAAMKGKRIIRFSEGLRALYLADVDELSDDDVIAQERKGPVVGEIDRADYLDAMKTSAWKPRPKMVTHLEAVERGEAVSIIRPPSRSPD